MLPVRSIVRNVSSTWLDAALRSLSSAAAGAPSRPSPAYARFVTSHYKEVAAGLPAGSSSKDAFSRISAMWKLPEHAAERSKLEGEFKSHMAKYQADKEAYLVAGGDPSVFQRKPKKEVKKRRRDPTRPKRVSGGACSDCVDFCIGPVCCSP
jgi:hypothetical protein